MMHLTLIIFMHRHMLLIFFPRQKLKQHISLLLRFQGQTEAQFCQSSSWRTNEFPGGRSAPTCHRKDLVSLNPTGMRLSL